VESSRIIIDPHSFNIYGTPGPGLGSIESDSQADSPDDQLLGGIHNVICRATNQAFREYQNVLKKHEKRREEDVLGSCKPSSRSLTRTMFDQVTVKFLSSKQLLLCTPVVRGYCLAFKTWGKSFLPIILSLFAKIDNCSPAEFYIENVRPIRWSENAFPRLVLPSGYKEIIRGFVQEQLSRDDEFDDIVYGKGTKRQPLSTIRG
jgi:hypothetical protein